MTDSKQEGDSVRPQWCPQVQMIRRCDSGASSSGEFFVSESNSGRARVHGGHSCRESAPPISAIHHNITPATEQTKNNNTTRAETTHAIHMMRSAFILCACLIHFLLAGTAHTRLVFCSPRPAGKKQSNCVHRRVYVLKRGNCMHN